MKKEYERIKKIVLDMMGIKDYDPRCRKNQFVVARILMANALLLKGYNQIEIGEAIGVNHAGIWYYREKLWGMLEFPNMYPMEVGLWNKLKPMI